MWKHDKIAATKFGAKTQAISHTGHKQANSSADIKAIKNWEHVKGQ